MCAKLDLRAAHANPEAFGTGYERGLVQDAIDVAVGAKRLLREIALSTRGRAELEHVLPVFVPNTPSAVTACVEIDLIDGLRKTPDGPARLASERLVHRKMDDVRRKEASHHVHRRSDVGETAAVAALADEERD